MSRPQSPVDGPDAVLDTYFATISHFFPEFWDWIDDLPDPRIPKKCQYTIRDLFCTELFRCFTLRPSHNQMDSSFNRNKASVCENMSLFCGSKTDSVPRGETINYLFKKLPSKKLAGMLDKMCTTLLDSKKLEIFREPLDNTLMLGSDGTGLFSTVVPIRHSTERHHRDGSCTYHVYALVIAFLSSEGHVLPFHVEFIENGEDYDPEFDKQDCEHKAQTKAFEKIHKLHPRLPVTMLMDALSLDYTQIMNCCNNNWHFVISYRDGAVKGLRERVAAMMESGKCVSHLTETREKDGVCTTLEHCWCRFPYDFGKAQAAGSTSVPVTYIKTTVTESKDGGPPAVRFYERITNHSITSGNVADFFKYMGGTRWCEENQGFNEMKNLGLNVEHAYGCQGEAVKNHFLLAMMAFSIMQLAGKTDIYQKIVENRQDTVAQDGKEAGTRRKLKWHSLREAFSSLASIGDSFLFELNRMADWLSDATAIASMRIRWVPG